MKLKAPLTGIPKPDIEIKVKLYKGVFTDLKKKFKKFIRIFTIT